MDNGETNKQGRTCNQLMQQCKGRIESQYPEAIGRLLVDEPMAGHSSFKVGGPADLVFLPNSSHEIVFAIQTATLFGIPFTILGNGTNILVSDKGIRGLTIIIGEKFSSIHREEAVIPASVRRDEEDVILAVDSGALLSTVAKFALKEGLTGMEFAAGIPGSTGGAVYMNAGAYDSCMADIVIASQGYDPENGKPFMLETPGEHQFAYRQSYYEKTGSIVIRTWIRLRKGNIGEIEKKMAEFSMKRKNSQPLEFPSAGSTFKRPAGNYAGKLIETAGLKGCRVGGACVSTKHAGFVINDKKASATDILELIHVVQDRVYKECGVAIDPEVRILGEW